MKKKNNGLIRKYDFFYMFFVYVNKRFVLKICFLFYDTSPHAILEYLRMFCVCVGIFQKF